MEEEKNMEEQDILTEEAAAGEATAGEAAEETVTGKTPEETAAEEAEAKAEPEDAGAGEGRLKKKPKPDKKADRFKEQLKELEDKNLRQMAEFENFRKRTEKEKAQMFEIGAKSVVEKILPIIDNFERGLKDAPEGPFSEGMQMIYRQLLTELEGLGVRPIEALGKEFDPNFHNAVMQVESGEYESGVVAQELQKGYMYRESVVRHSMVAVVS